MKKKAWFELKILCSRYFVGKKHFKKSERVYRSFLELKRVIIRRALRFWSGFHGRAVENSKSKHQRSSLESSRIDPFWIRATRLDPFSTRIESLGSKSWKQLDLPTKTSSVPPKLGIIVFSFYVSSSMYIFCHDFMQ